MQSTLLTHGSLLPFPKSTVVTAGELKALYENGFLRYISHGDTEVIRMINLTVRDHNWHTIVPEIRSEKIESTADSFVIEYEARCREGVVDFLWKCIIRGSADSVITFHAEGKALSAFRRNRVGITVLHPIESCTGKDCVITHPDGTTQTEQFPAAISPTQPFFSICSMTWSPDESIEAIINFEGDLFETEDQRNWLDSSYKTYCTPLSIPFPVAVNAGDEVKQSIQLQVKSHAGKTLSPAKPLTFTLDGEKRFPFPKIGIPLSHRPHTDQIIERIKALQIDFVRVEVNISDPGHTAILQQAGEIVSKLSCQLEVVLFVDDNIPDDVVQRLLPLSKYLHEFIVLPAKAKSADAKLIRQIVPRLRKHFPDKKIGSGTDAFFTELNRSRTPPEELDFLTFAVNPQVHAFDVRTMTENLLGHRYVVESCRQFAGGKAVHVGPVTLKMRANPNATSRDEIVGSEVLPSYVDARQLSLYAAGWTLGSFKYLAENQVEAITYYQTCGWAGLVSHPDESWPDDYAVPSRCVYPVYLLLLELLLHKKKRIKPLISSHPLVMDGVAFVDEAGNETILLANLTPEKQNIQFLLKGFTSRTIDAGNVRGLMEGTAGISTLSSAPIDNALVLPPFALALIEK